MGGAPCCVGLSRIVGAHGIIENQRVAATAAAVPGPGRNPQHARLRMPRAGAVAVAQDPAFIRMRANDGVARTACK